MNKKTDSRAGHGIAGLMMNFTKLAILLAFAFLVILIVHMKIQIFGVFDVVVLDITDSNINTSDGKVRLAYYVAPGFHSGTINPQLQVSDATGNTHPVNPEPHEKGKPYYFTFQVQDFKRAPQEGIYVLKYCVVQASYHSKEHTTTVNYHVPIHCEDCCPSCPPRCEECPPPREYEMYIVEKQWNFLPSDLLSSNVDFTITLPTTRQTLNRPERLDWQPDWHLQEEAIVCTGIFSRGLTGNFRLRILGVGNKPPEALSGLWVALGDPRNLFDDCPDLPLGFDRHGFDLSKEIIDPDGVAADHAEELDRVTGRKHPKADFLRYTLVERPDTFRIILNDKPYQGATPPYPYSVYQSRTDHRWYLVRKVGTQILAPLSHNQKLLEKTYERFEVTARNPNGEPGGQPIEIRIYYTGR